MSRRRYLGMKINRDWEQRFIKRQANAADIKITKDQFSQTNRRTISPMEFEEYVSQRSEANTKTRWRSSIGNQRDTALLGNLIRRQFGPNAMIVLGGGSPLSAKFHAPTVY